MGTIEIVGDAVVHGWIAMCVAVVVGTAIVDTRHHNGAVEE